MPMGPGTYGSKVGRPKKKTGARPSRKKRGGASPEKKKKKK
jgi:hypothetical protein